MGWKSKDVKDVEVKDTEENEVIETQDETQQVNDLSLVENNVDSSPAQPLMGMNEPEDSDNPSIVSQSNAGNSVGNVTKIEPKDSIISNAVDKGQIDVDL